MRTAEGNGRCGRLGRETGCARCHSAIFGEGLKGELSLLPTLSSHTQSWILKFRSHETDNPLTSGLTSEQVWKEFGQ